MHEVMSPAGNLQVGSDSARIGIGIESRRGLFTELVKNGKKKKKIRR